jgi:hypothetical protein
MRRGLGVLVWFVGWTKAGTVAVIDKDARAAVAHFAIDNGRNITRG